MNRSSDPGRGKADPTPAVRLLRWIRISRVRGTALATLAAALLGVPVALTTLDLSADTRHPSREHIATNERSAGVVPEQLSPAVAEARAMAARLRQLPNDDLVQLVRHGQALERLAALNVLWLRGRRLEAQTLARESNDRALLAKLAALEARTK